MSLLVSVAVHKLNMHSGGILDQVAKCFNETEIPKLVSGHVWNKINTWLSYEMSMPGALPTLVLLLLGVIGVNQ